MLSSPFQQNSIAESIIKLWRGRALPLPEYGLTLCLKEYPHFRGKFSVRSLLTVYDAALRCEYSERGMHDLAETIHRISSQFGVNSVSLRIGTEDPRGKVRSPKGFEWRHVDDLGVVDLTAGFSSYLSSRKSGYAEYYKRGLKRGLYTETLSAIEIARADFDAFLERVKATYRTRGYSYKQSPDRDEAMFRSLQEGKAFLFSVAAKENPKVFADVYAFHDGKTAYYYMASRNTPVKGVLAGVAHYAQIAFVRELIEKGFISYTLGSVAQHSHLPRSEAGVREYKLGLSTKTEPLVQLSWESFSVQAFNRYIFFRKCIPALFRALRPH